MKKLVLIRHAKAVRYSAAGDHGRELSPGGRDQALRLGSELADLLSQADLAVISTSARTRQTATGVSSCLPIVHVEADENLYLTGVDELIETLRWAARGDTVIHVGHEPTISGTALALHQGTGDIEPDKWERRILGGVPTATAVVLEVPGEWSDLAEGSARIVAFLHAPYHRE